MVELKNNITTVRVSFHALQKQYTVTELPVSVPLGLKRYGLSEIINHLLELGALYLFFIYFFTYIYFICYLRSYCPF
jgi:hypothetical protein